MALDKESARENPHDNRPQRFVGTLSDVMGGNFEVETIDDTHTIDADTFRLDFTLDKDSFEIRNIESRAQGAGSRVVEVIHDFCDMYGLDVRASNVKDTARGFWLKMGYEEGEEGQFFRIS